MEDREIDDAQSHFCAIINKIIGNLRSSMPNVKTVFMPDMIVQQLFALEQYSLRDLRDNRFPLTTQVSWFHPKRREAQASSRFAIQLSTEVVANGRTLGGRFAMDCR